MNKIMDKNKNFKIAGYASTDEEAEEIEEIVKISKIGRWSSRLGSQLCENKPTETELQKPDQKTPLFKT